MTQILNISEDLPATVTLQLSRFDPATLVAMANDLSSELHEVRKLQPDFNVPVATRMRAFNEIRALRSLYDILRDHVARFHPAMYLSEIIPPEEDVA